MQRSAPGEIIPTCVYTLSEVAALLRLPDKVIEVAIRAGELKALVAGPEWRILGQCVIDYVAAGGYAAQFRPEVERDAYAVYSEPSVAYDMTSRPSAPDDLLMSDRPSAFERRWRQARDEGESRAGRYAQRRDETGKPANVYNIATARGGRDDKWIEAELGDKWDALSAGEALRLTTPMHREAWPHWNGSEIAEIRDEDVVFLDKRGGTGVREHAVVPAGIKAAVRVLHRNGIRGRFEIGVWDEYLTIAPRSSPDSEASA